MKLPKLLYAEKNNVQNEKDEKKILLGTHHLCKYFNLEKYLCYDENNNLISRAIVTVYPNKREAYIGFFESFDNKDAVKQLFYEIERDLKNLSINKIIGPVDASFWIKYRLKIDKKVPKAQQIQGKSLDRNILLSNNYTSKMQSRWRKTKI